MQLYSGSLTFSAVNDAHACCFVPALYDSGKRKTITDIYCEADGAYVNGYSICFEYAMIDDETSFSIFVRDESGQWHMSDECSFADLLTGETLELDTEPCDNPREQGGEEPNKEPRD